ncbi:glycoside hydrolase family 25 protein [Bifidobacterium biavatii]|uniref:Glycosyl hydrolase family 25 n=1 Tax=Bifidobacterium biavatii DSM 23969 TaxID=1437608 RepID=A0A086ZN37_9BIFI|nr:glycoside hydrolase family 25 protein [Bifidobacterium biavatii]KFI47937.1 glycosyl hydrolase family 25 [Bifidobacterium biavatii DSM 23969]
MVRKIRACVATIAIAATLAVAGAAPAYALRDVAVEPRMETRSDSVIVTGDRDAGDRSALSDDAVVADGTGAMPDNPIVDLPDTVNDSIPDDATVVSPDLAVTSDGKVKDLETGKTVTDPSIVGTESAPADPLAKTNGESFIPVEAGDVKSAIASSEQSEQSGATRDANDGTPTVRSSSYGAAATVRNASVRSTSGTKTDSSVTLAAFSAPDVDYGTYWGTYQGKQAFYDADGNVFASDAKSVVDVSEWQYTIDWAKAKAAGVQGAIIRIGYGWGNGLDKYALRNIKECKRLGIPFGVYLYSYAEDAAGGKAEGKNTVALLEEAGVSPSDLSYPVYYDLEKWTWTGHKPPTSPAVYEKIVNAWYAQLIEAGYANLSIYSYTSYLNGPLNSTALHAKTRWVAQYGPRMDYTDFPTTSRGWQYTSGGSVAGITGRVDLNAFGNEVTSANEGDNDNDDSDADETGIPVYRVYNPNSGLHHYTTSYDEVKMLVAQGWRYEDVSFYAAETGTPVYRLYNSHDGNHHYTMSAGERDYLVAAGWNYEKIAWYVPKNGKTVVYRLYNPNSGEHVFTTSVKEYNAVGAAGWNQEGTAWLAQ